MSWAAAGWIKHCRLGSPVRKAVMLVVADFATEDGTPIGANLEPGEAVCWAGTAVIAEHSEVGQSTVRRVLTDMETAGVIRRVRRGRTSGLGGRTTDAIFIDYTKRWVVTAPADTAPELPPDASANPVDAPADSDEPVDNLRPDPGLALVREAQIGRAH